MKLRRIVCLLLALALALAMAACNKAPDTVDTTTESIAAPADAAADSAAGDAAADAADTAGYTGEAIEISLAHNLAVGSVLDQACNKLAELVSEKSGGKIKIVVYPAAQLGNERDMIEGIQMGTIDIVLATTAYISNIQPEFAVLDLPFVFDDLDHVQACLNGDVGAQLRETLSNGQDMHILGYLNSGFRDMLTAKTKLEDLDSFKGLRIRAPEVDVYIKMFQALGAKPTPIAFSEVYTSIQTDVVEGVEVSADQIYTMKFYEVGKYIAKTNHIFTTVAPICMNSYWDSLNDDAKTIIDEAMAEVVEWEWPAFDESNNNALTEMEKAGIEINDIDRDQLREACLGVHEEIASANNCTDLLEMINSARAN